jgi:acyl carrier protein
MVEAKHIKETVGAFIVEEFMYGESPQSLTDSTPLISSGILDSLTTLRLVEFIEKNFDITFEAHEAGVENLETLNDIARFVVSKKA